MHSVVTYGMRAGPAASIQAVLPRREVICRYSLCLLLVVHPVCATELVGQVVSIQDGDTLTVLVERNQIRVRLVDIDAPEKAQPFGSRSRQSLSTMCVGRSAVVNSRGKDRFGRTLGQVSCSGIDANAEQVRRGMAWVFVRYAPPDSPLYKLQGDAQAERRGLWIDPQPMAPWEWRSSRSTR